MTSAKCEPISCEFHDLLESHATLRRPTRVRFRATAGEVKELTATIDDVFAREGAEYVVLGTGETLRLDQLLEVGDARLSDF